MGKALRVQRQVCSSIQAASLLGNELVTWKEMDETKHKKSVDVHFMSIQISRTDSQNSVRAPVRRPKDYSSSVQALRRVWEVPLASSSEVLAVRRCGRWTSYHSSVSFVIICQRLLKLRFQMNSPFLSQNQCQAAHLHRKLLNLSWASGTSSWNFWLWIPWSPNSPRDWNTSYLTFTMEFSGEHMEFEQNHSWNSPLPGLRDFKTHHWTPQQLNN